MAVTDDPDKLGQLVLNACELNQEEQAIRLLNKGAQVNEYGWNPLHLTAANGEFKVAELLLQKGADANAKDRRGNTPLMIACECGHREVAILLIGHGAEVNVMDGNGRSPLYWAAYNDMLELAEHLLQKGADANAKDRRGNTPLTRACEYGHREVASLLIERGAEVLVSDEDGRSPLYWAAYNGKYKLAEHLLQKGADPEAKSHAGRTPVMVACKNGHREVTNLLLEHGARADVHCLYLAVASGNLDVSLAQLLIRKGALANLKDTAKAREIEEAIAKSDWWTACRLLDKVLSAPTVTTWLPDYERAVSKQGSVTLDVTRTIFMGPPAAGKSSLKHLLVHNESKVINTSTPVLETPAIVSLSSEQFAAQEASSSWKVVSDESMAACVRIACRCQEYKPVPLNPVAKLTQVARNLFKHRGSEKKQSGTKSKERSNPDAHLTSQPVLPEEEEVVQPRLALEQAHKTLLDNLGTGVEDQLLQTARFVHLLDSGGQPSFQDALPLLLQVPCTYVLVFDASQNLDEPLRITYRCDDATEEEQANLETGWEMLLRLLSGVHTLAHKCSSSMGKFQEKGGRLPQFRIVLVGTFRDRLLREGRLREAIEAIRQHVKLLEKKPYYKHIARDSTGQPFFLINNRLYLDAVGNGEEDQACVSDLRRLLSDPAASLKLQVPLGWFQFELVTRQVKEKFFKVSDLRKSALKLQCISNAKEFQSLLSLFHFLGFFTYFEQEGISDTVCTDNTVFLKEVSKLLAVQYIQSPRTQAVEAFKEKGILCLDEHLSNELGLSKELDRRWLLRVLCHLGLTACYTQSDAGLPKYFFPAAIRSQGTQESVAGSVAPLLVAFVFKEDAFNATHDMPRGIFCHLAVELAANRGWTVISEKSTRLAIRFRVKELIVVIEESMGFICIVPIISIHHAACDAGKLHDHCRTVISTIKETVQESGRAVFGDQFTDRANVNLGFHCPCEIQSPHLAVPSGGSIVCQLSQNDQRYLQSQQVWFSHVEGAELRPHPSYPKMLHLVETTSLQPGKGGGPAQREVPVFQPPPVTTEDHPIAKQQPREPTDDPTSPFSASKFLNEYEEEFFHVVNAKQSLLKLKHKGVISPDVKTAINGANDEDAKYILFEHLETNATLDTLSEYCSVAIAAKGFPRMQALGRKMREALPLGAPVPHPAPVMTEAHPMAKQRPTEPSDDQTSAFSASQFLKEYEEDFSQFVNAKQSLLKLKHKGVISPHVKTSIDSANDEDAKYILFEHLEKNATVANLREYCSVAIAAKGFQGMQALGRKMMEALPLGAPVPHPTPVMTDAHPMAKQRPSEPSDDQIESPPSVAETGGSGKDDTLSQRVNDHPDHQMLLRTYVSRKAAGKGRAVLEGVRLDSDTIEACFQSNPFKDEEAVQAGLIRWKDGQGRPPTWKVLIEAMKYAGVAQQHIDGLKADLYPK